MIRSNDGSVSLYLMIILSVFLLLFAVLIDFARIRIADHQLDTALQAAVRSGLADFDRDLQPYGMYAMAAYTDNMQTVETIVQNHLKYDSGEGSFRLVRSESTTVEARVDPTHALSNHDVFKHQVLEEMKYMAPIEFTLEVADKFNRTGAGADMVEATTFYHQIEKLEQLRLERESLLDQAWDSLGGWIGTGGQLHRMHSFYSDQLQRMNELAGRIGSYTEPEVLELILLLKVEISLLEQSIERIQNRIASITSGAEELTPSQQQRLSQLRKQLQSTVMVKNELEREVDEWESILKDILEFHRLNAQTKSRLESDPDRLEQAIKHWLSLWEQAEKKNKEMADLLDRYEQDPDKDSIVELREQLLIESAYFQQLNTRSQQLAVLLNQFKTEYNRQPYPTGQHYSDVYPSLSDSLRNLHQFMTRFYSEQAAKETRRQGNNRDVESEKQKVNAEIEDVIEEIRDLLYECGPGDAGAYALLKDSERKYKEWNEMNAQWKEEASPPPDLNEAAGMPKNSMGMLERLQKALVSFRDDAYTNEYVLYYFNYRTYGKNDKPSIPPSSKPDQHVLLQQEAEYVLYGLGSCQANQIAAFSEIFAVRMGIRTMEALLNPKSAVKVGNPLLMFLYAALEGAVKAAQDMRSLVAGEEVELTARLNPKITLNYKDYIRLFLAIHTQDLNKLSRVQALIELNTGVLLEEKYTHMEAEAGIKIRLWALPAKEREWTRTAGWWY